MGSKSNHLLLITNKVPTTALKTKIQTTFKSGKLRTKQGESEHSGEREEDAMSLAGVGAIQVRPSEPSQGAGLTSALLRTRLSAALKNNGTVDMLKSQLRAKVLSELRSSSLAVSESSKKARPLVEQAANLLIMDYLQNSGYLCTASVFAPESGVPVAASGSLSDTEFLREVQQVLDLLHIHPDSRLYKRMMSVRGTSAIRTLLEYVTHSADQAPGVTNSACQTTATETQTIDRKMEQINERYRGLAHENAMAPLKTLEERLAQCQRDADARIRAEVEEAVTTLRKVEMSKMRLEEQAKYSQQLAQVLVISPPHPYLPLTPVEIWPPSPL